MLGCKIFIQDNVVVLTWISITLPISNLFESKSPYYIECQQVILTWETGISYIIKWKVFMKSKSKFVPSFCLKIKTTMNIIITPWSCPMWWLLRSPLRKSWLVYSIPLTTSPTSSQNRLLSSSFEPLCGTFTLILFKVNHLMTSLITINLSFTLLTPTTSS